MSAISSLFKYWGKAGPKEASQLSWHPLVYHCLDVAAVGSLLLKKETLFNQRLQGLLDFNESYFPFITFLFTTHDIGKFAEGFQNTRKDLFQHLHGRSSLKNYTERHDVLGYRLWEEEIFRYLILKRWWKNETEDEEDLWDLIVPWLRAVTGHHGVPPRKGTTLEPLHYEFGDGTLESIHTYLEEIRRILLLDRGFPWLNPSGDSNNPLGHSAWTLAGLAVLADWIGSNQKWFPFHMDPLDLEDYWYRFALPRAEIALSESGVLPVSISDATGLTKLFATLINPTELQIFAESEDLPPGPQLFIFEEVTGGGKTEAALTLAHRLMAEGRAEGIYIALPTMATANAMFGRTGELPQRIFKFGTFPSLVLAHSARHLFNFGLERQEKGAVDKGDEENASFTCTAWLADSRKKALLAQMGVGTIDQALLAILPSRHQSLRLLGLERNVLIVDEVHACDAYMNRLLCRLLEFQSALGGSVILLSATLPKKMRQELTDAFRRGLKKPKLNPQEEGYPLVTHVAADSVMTKSLAARPEMVRTVRVEMEHSIERIRRQLVNTVNKDCKCACWVRNTVVDAIETYNALLPDFGPDNLYIFHARFAMGDRLAIEGRIQEFFGKQSTPTERAGKLLIATQVVEQSLDLDFDLMVTDLAPIDIIFQRAGRLCRHARDKQGNPINGPDQRGIPTLMIYTPPMENAPGSDWYRNFFPRAAAVYPHHGQIWLTAQILASRGQFQIPEDSRTMIEGVYSDEAQGRIPEGLRKRELEAEGKDKGDASLGTLNSLKLEDGYQATFHHWQDDTVSPTRLGEPMVTVRLSHWQSGKMMPWINDPDFGWELSQVSVRRHLIAGTDPDLDRGCVEDALLAMPDQGKWSILVPLKEKDGNWIGSAINAEGKRVTLRYTPRIGLTVEEGD